MNTETSQFYSHGKLLITGEYLVIFGAKSLAVPVKFGQDIKVYPGETGYLKWEAFIKSKPWFSATFSLKALDVIQTSDIDKTSYLKTVILEAKKMNIDFLPHNTGYSVKTNLDYPQEWGLGSSSTFISNLAWWAQVDPMQLNQAVSSGSGFDIACARSESPIIYEMTENKPKWQKITFHPPYADHLFFLFLGKKQDTTESVSEFRKQYNFSIEHIEYINELTNNLLLSDNLDDAIQVLEEHEIFMSSILKIQSIKIRMFPDFIGTMKSLGAWGGDFALVTSPLHFDEVKGYFRNKGFETLFKFEDIVMSGSSVTSL